MCNVAATLKWAYIARAEHVCEYIQLANEHGAFLFSLSFFLYTFSSIWHIRMQCVCVHRAVCRIAVSINANCLTLARISILRCAPCYKFDLNSSTSTSSISINQHEKSQTRIFNFVYCEIEKMGWIVCENCKNQARSHERVNECDLRKPNWMCDIMFKQ